MGSGIKLASLTLAGYGWSPMDWGQHLYPADLPADWRMDYYANMFQYLALPASHWGSATVLDASLLKAMPRNLGIYLEITTELLAARYWTQVQMAVETHLATQVVGLWVQASAVTALPETWAQRFPVHCVVDGAWLAVMPAGADAQLGLLRAAEALSPLALRQLFEQLQAQSAHKDVVLLLDVPWSSVVQIQLMQQLYGL